MTAAAGQRMDTCERYAPWGERGAGHPEGLGRVGCRTKHVRTFEEAREGNRIQYGSINEYTIP